LGLIDEVVELNKLKLDNWTPLQSVGYKEVQQYLKGEIHSFAELEEQILISTRPYLGSSTHSFFSSIFQVANRVAKVATQRNIATDAEIFDIGSSGTFVLFQLLRTVCFFEFSVF